VEKDTSIWISILRDTLWPRHEISRCNFWRCWRFQEDHFSWRSMEPHQILNLCLVFETAFQQRTRFYECVYSLIDRFFSESLVGFEDSL
jgi:hypothetical protein